MVLNAYIFENKGIKIKGENIDCGFSKTGDQNCMQDEILILLALTWSTFDIHEQRLKSREVQSTKKKNPAKYKVFLRKMHS